MTPQNQCPLRSPLWPASIRDGGTVLQPWEVLRAHQVRVLGKVPRGAPVPPLRGLAARLPVCLWPVCLWPACTLAQVSILGGCNRVMHGQVVCNDSV